MLPVITMVGMTEFGIAPPLLLIAFSTENVPVAAEAIPIVKAGPSDRTAG